MKSRLGDKSRRAGSGRLPAGHTEHLFPILGTSNIGTVRADTVERTTGLKLGIKVRLDLVTPVLREPQNVGQRRSRFSVLAHVADITFDSRLIQPDFQ